MGANCRPDLPTFSVSSILPPDLTTQMTNLSYNTFTKQRNLLCKANIFQRFSVLRMRMAALQDWYILFTLLGTVTMYWPLKGR